MVTLRPLSSGGLMHVALNMRDADAAEIFALRFDDDRARIATEAKAFSRFGALAYDGATPVAAIGAAEVTPGCFEMWLFATDAWPVVARAVARHAFGRLIPALLAAGGRRGQCLSLSTRLDAHRFLERLGFLREGELRARGRNGETFFLYAWRRSDVLLPLSPVLHPTERGPVGGSRPAGR